MPPLAALFNLPYPYHIAGRAGGEGRASPLARLDVTAPEPSP